MLSWHPSATLEALRLRADILATIRQFFAKRQVLEVETPLLCQTSVTDPFIHSLPVFPSLTKTHPYFLQTSPEYAMKRLLAAGSGAIYQICKAFRQEELGRFHNPEFSLLEWYRPGFNHYQLMDEVDELLQIILKVKSAEKISYESLFQTKCHINPHTISLEKLKACCKQYSIYFENNDNDNDNDNKDTWLNLLLSHYIEPTLGEDRPCFIYDFPPSQAALAKIQQTPIPRAARFEVYFRGIELANGFYELQDAKEQRSRFIKNNQDREQLGHTPMSIDELFLAALEAGLPDCSGVALGIDRLMMLAAKTNHIADILSFDFTRV